MTDYRTVPVELLSKAAGLLDCEGYTDEADALNAALSASPAPAGDLPLDLKLAIHRWIRDETSTALKFAITPEMVDSLARAVIAAMQPVGWRDMESELDRAKDALVKASVAINAAYAQAQAEYQGHDAIASRHDKTVRAGREAIRDVLEPLPAAPGVGS